MKTTEFASSRLLKVYTEELYWLCEQIDLKCEKLFKFHSAMPNEFSVSADIEGLDLVYSILSYAAKAQEIIFNFSKNKEKLHEGRAKYIQGLLQPLALKEMLNKKVRNTIEHFGEYLDVANEVHTAFRAPKKYAVAFNLVISHWNRFDDQAFPFSLYKIPQLDLPLYPVRVYVSDEKVFYNLDWSIELAVVHKEAIDIKRHLISRKVFKEENPEKWISKMIIC